MTDATKEVLKQHLETIERLSDENAYLKKRCEWLEEKVDWLGFQVESRFGYPDTETNDERIKTLEIERDKWRKTALEFHPYSVHRRNRDRVK